ncbi:MAG: iron uptake transporter permease EfeU [Marmoricola sp.]
MRWSDAVPNLVIGLREGLEMGLVVTILLAAIRKLAAPAEQRAATRPLWLGVAAALGLSVSFGAILTFSTAELSSKGEEIVAGVLSVLAVGLVTAMIFWMRRTAATLSAQLRGEVEKALALGTGALALTAFFAVAREGLETTLFLWTAVKASGDTAAPLVGGAIGLALAIGLCWLLYRRAIHFNLGVFFNRTAILLIIIAAGILAYGLGDLQEAGVLPGHDWTAFDLTAHISPTTWWVSIIGGLTNLAPSMTVLQVVAWAVYLAVVVYAFVRAARPAPAGLDTRPAGALDQRVGGRVPPKATYRDLLSRNPRLAAGALITVPALIAVVVIVAMPSASADGKITVTADTCAPEWSSARTGTQTFAVSNKAGMSGEVMLMDANGGIAGEIETLGPGTTANLVATLSASPYHFRCIWSNGNLVKSVDVTPTGDAVVAPLATKPASVAELEPANQAYIAYAQAQLGRLASKMQTLRTTLASGNLAASRAQWLDAQLAWELVGASYNSFGDPGVAIDGFPSGLPKGVADPKFTGLHRIEYGLFHGQSPTSLVPVADRLLADITSLRKQVAEIASDPVDLTLRAHEILEDAQRDHLSGVDNFGGNAAYPMTWANLQVTRTVWNELATSIKSRNAKLFAQAEQAFDRLEAALAAVRVNGTWLTPAQASVMQRAQINAALSEALEIAAEEPGLLEVPKGAVQ